MKLYDLLTNVGNQICNKYRNCWGYCEILHTVFEFHYKRKNCKQPCYLQYILVIWASTIFHYISTWSNKSSIDKKLEQKLSINTSNFFSNHLCFRFHVFSFQFQLLDWTCGPWNYKKMRLIHPSCYSSLVFTLIVAFPI